MFVCSSLRFRNLSKLRLQAGAATVLKEAGCPGGKLIDRLIAYNFISVAWDTS